MTRPIAAVVQPMKRGRQRFVGWVMKLKRGGSKRRKTYHYFRWTLLIAVIAGLIAVGLAQLRVEARQPIPALPEQSR
jgi:hypothetical protein